MTFMQFVITVLPAIAYFYFHWNYFSLIGNFDSGGRIKMFSLIVSYIIIYVLFSVCSILELHLVINWTLFLFALLAATLILCHGIGNRHNALLFTLSGIYYGLSINIFTRCIIALMINKPLSSFDNNISSVYNLKGVPIILGFLLAGVLIHFAGRKGLIQQKSNLLCYPQQVKFLNRLLIGLILYLDLNLLLYQTAGNELILKLWGIKSCIASIVGYYLGMRYALRMSELTAYREETRRIQEEIYRKEEEEKNLKRIAYRDVLTGCYNRIQAVSFTNELIKSDTRFTLCFIDLDRLKYVNDVLSHQSGDEYLVMASEAIKDEFRRYQDFLFRYGGDEFVLLLVDMESHEALERLEGVNGKLAEMEKKENIPFPMSISFGITESGEADNTEDLIHIADKRMYKYKLAKKKVARDV